jgi:outer membrane protein TolC
MRKSRKYIFALALGCATFGGCSWTANQICKKEDFCFKPSMAPTQGPQQLIPSEPCIDDVCVEHWQENISPLDLDEKALTGESTTEMSLQECIYFSLSNSRVMRDLGGALLRSPETSVANLNPAMAYTDPRTGEEAALSEFDAQLIAGINAQKNDRQYNNGFFGNNGLFQQDLHNYEWGIRKKSATGSEFNFRNVTVYDSNNQVSNIFQPSSWDTYLEGEVRQPLLQGAGTEFNRIAGPNATPGIINGVLIGRVRTDISLAEFERAVRDLVADVENAYWDLYFAYRDLEAKIDARDKAFEIYEKTRVKAEVAQSNDTSDVEQAKEQWLRFQADVVDALNGRPVDSTRTNNGSSGGTFRGSGGLRFAERRLRLIVGMPINDTRIIRPSANPSEAPIVYDWNTAIADALTLRPELRKQRWVIEHRKLELIANKNFLRPDLDLVGRYRFRGFGEGLVDYNGNSNATSSLLDGGLQEWQAGVEYTMPIGFRKAHTAVRNSQLALSREVEILKEQERSVHFGLSNSINEIRRSYENMLIQRQRLAATISQINTLNNKGDTIALDVLLEAHRRLLDTRLRYHQAQIDYVIANRNVHFEKGTLLQYCNIGLTESESPNAAVRDASERNQLRGSQLSPDARDRIIGTSGMSVKG